MHNLVAIIQIPTQHNWQTIATVDYDYYKVTLNIIRQSTALKGVKIRVLFDYSAEYKALCSAVAIANKSVQSKESMSYILENFPVNDSEINFDINGLYSELELDGELLNPSLSSEIEDTIIEV